MSFVKTFAAITVALIAVTAQAETYKLPECGKPNEIYITGDTQNVLPVCPRYKDYPKLPVTYVIVMSQEQEAVDKAIEKLMADSEPQITIIETNETY